MMKLFITGLVLLTAGGLGFANGTQRFRSERGPLILEGQVKSLKYDGENARAIDFKITLLLTFQNIGTTPIIMYRKNLWLGGRFLSRTIEDSRSYKFIYDSTAWPSVWGKDSRERIRRALDQPSPPLDLTLILQPGESWQYETDTFLGLYKKESPEAQGLTWGEIRSASPVWLFVMFEMWPVNAEPKVDPDKPEFGKMLRKRWRRSGELWLDYLTSEPIALDFNNMKVAQQF